MEFMHKLAFRYIKLRVFEYKTETVSVCAKYTFSYIAPMSGVYPLVTHVKL